MEIREQVPLAPLTTLGVGGPARYFVEARSDAEVREAVTFARERGLRLFVLGGGSNLVIADRGWPGLVLRVAIRGFKESGGVFEAGAGEDWDGLVERAVERGCAGIECMSGIPGTVGGTPIQNVGAYGQEVGETIRAVRVLELASGEIGELTNEECGFQYRTSRFNGVDRGRWVVLAVTFALKPGGAPRLAYPDLKKFFAGRGSEPTLQETRQAVRRIRKSKAMLIVEGDADARSAGSFFKNPVVDAEAFSDLEARAATRGLEVPSFVVADGSRKIPAAWLVERSGFEKGTTRGAVGISSKHALAIVNRGGATAAEIIRFKEEIQSRVLGEFGVEMQPEPAFVGFE